MVVASDLEGTLTAGETWKGLRSYLRAHGRGNAYLRFFLWRLPAALAAKAGLIDSPTFRDRWMIDLARLFPGLTEQDWRGVAEWVTEHELWPKRRQSVVDELRQHQSAGHRLVIASATYQPVLEAFAQRIEATALGTKLEMSGDRSTGRIVPPMGSGKVKADRLKAWIGDDTLLAAYGDTPPDMYMFELAESPVVVHPGSTLRKIAQQRGWRILLS